MPALLVFPRGFFWFYVLAFLLHSCATYDPKYSDPAKAVDLPESREIVHTFYLIGDAGLSPMDTLNPVLTRFRDRLSGAPENSTALFLGDNIYPSGMPSPKKSEEDYQEARNNLDAQLKTLDRFRGRPIFIPGNHDWYSKGIKGLERQEKYIREYLDRKDAFLPEDGCPLEEVEIARDLLLITVDSKWYLANWDRTPSINDDCAIKSRDKFWAELESTIKKNANKTILIAIHHPIFTYGTHGGQFSARQQLYPAKKVGPLPGLGSLLNLFRKTSGASTEDLYNRRYTEMRNRMITLASYGERVLFASGHEHTLQFIVEEGMPQIVSGAGAKTGATRLLGGSRFSTGMGGYAVMEVYKDGGSRVRYYGVNEQGEESFLFTDQVFQPGDPGEGSGYPEEFPPYKKASIYTKEEVSKGKLYRTLWGDRYREYYGREVEAPTVRLDTLYGGLIPVRKGGGQQSKSLRLRHASGKEYVMRALRKQPEQSIQAMAFPDQFIMGQFEGTAPVNFLQDLFTGAHPYAPFSTGILSDSLGIYHPNPRLFFVPKQPALGPYNTDFGNELYMIEEHVSEGHDDLASFGYTRAIESTFDLMDRLREDEKYAVDTDMYIRARLFDILLGDWDRHQDQWRWAEFRDRDSGQVVYRPIPRDRDQVFSIMGDGSMGWWLTRMIPILSKMESYSPDVRNLYNFNSSGYTLDRALLSEATLDTWLAQARYIQEHLSEDLIDHSFEGFPKEVRDSTLVRIKDVLMERSGHLEAYAREYYEVVQEYAMVSGTDKDDWFDIVPHGKGGVSISGYRIISGEKSKQFYHKEFTPGITREIWLYGLDDGDRFRIDLPPGNRIRVRIVGGLGKDRYEVVNGKKVHIYDHKSKKSELTGRGRASTLFTDDYEINTYQPLKRGNTTRLLLPVLGYNPDDGVKLGLGYTFTRFGFLRNPFTTRHTFKGAYYFATSGFELGYSGEFARVLGKWNLQLAGRYTTPNFTYNFFGFGNETPNPEDELGLDYNRVRMRILDLSPALVWRGPLGASMDLRLSYQYITVEETEGRFINSFYQQNGQETTTQYLGLGGKYQYANRDNEAFPTLGMEATLEAGYRYEVSGTEQDFGYVIPSLALDHRLIPSGNLVLATRWKAHFNIGGGYNFFQGAQIGASDGPRSYRNQRFTGKTSYYQITDLRYQFPQMKTSLFPLALGVYTGFDYGRVWQPSESSGKWHTSYGGGLFANGARRFSANAALFHGAEGPRFSFGLGFSF